MSIEKLSRYLDHELADREVQAVEVHLQECPDCRGELGLLKSIAAKAGSALYDDPGEAYWKQFPAEILDKIGLKARPDLKISFRWLHEIRDLIITLWQPNRLAFKLVGAAAVLVLIYIVSQDVYKGFSIIESPQKKKALKSDTQELAVQQAPAKISPEKDKTRPVFAEERQQPIEKQVYAEDMPEFSEAEKNELPTKKTVSEPGEEIATLSEKVPETIVAMNKEGSGNKEVILDIEEMDFEEEIAMKAPAPSEAAAADVSVAEESVYNTGATASRLKPAETEKRREKSEVPELSFTPVPPKKSSSTSKKWVTGLLRSGKKTPKIQSQFMATQKQDAYGLAYQKVKKTKGFAEKEAVWLSFLKQYPRSPKRIQAKAELAMLYYENSVKSKENLQKAIKYFEKEKDDLTTAFGLRRYQLFRLRLKKN